MNAVLIIIEQAYLASMKNRTQGIVQKQERSPRISSS